MNQEIAVRGKDAHRYFLILRKYLMLKIGFDTILPTAELYQNRFFGFYPAALHNRSKTNKDNPAC
jgi:hypothetical protein